MTIYNIDSKQAVKRQAKRTQQKNRQTPNGNSSLPSNRLVFLSLLSSFCILCFSKFAYSQESIVTSEPPSLDIEAASARKADTDKEAIENDNSVQDQSLTSQDAELEPSSPEQEPSNSRDEESIKSSSAEPIIDSAVSVKPTINIPPELKESLARQFNQIQLLYETEEAFSEKLAENYLSYGKLLMQVTRTDEAKEAFINALHITKVNNGINSIEQRPILRELFEISYALKELKEADKLITQITNLEKKHPQTRDTFSYDMLMRIGHLYMRTYRENPVGGESGLFLINRSIKYFKYTVARYGDRKISELFLPYGELAYLWFLKNQVKLNINSDYKNGLRSNGFPEIDRSRTTSITTPPKARNQSLNYMSLYYKKAEEEGDIENMVRALLNTADLYLMYQRYSTAKQFYYSAWEKSQLLPANHKLLNTFDAPVRLPSFKYALVKSNLEPVKEVNEMRLNLTIDNNGRVRKIRDQNKEPVDKNTRLKAFRKAKGMMFRPILENGKPLKVSEIDYLVTWPVRKRKL